MTKVTDRTAVEVWMEVIAWLTEAADLGETQIGRRPHHYCLGLGAVLLAEKAVQLLQDDDRARLDEVGLPAAAAGMSVPELIEEAERLLSTLSFDQLPAVASAVVIDLGDLVGESRHG